MSGLTIDDAVDLAHRMSPLGDQVAACTACGAAFAPVHGRGRPTQRCEPCRAVFAKRRANGSARRATQLEQSLRRAGDMTAMYRQGLTLQQIGTRYDMTRERVRQILRWAGIDPTDGGVVVRSSRRRSAAALSKEAFSLARYGTDADTVRRIRAARGGYAFNSQRSAAVCRGIPWELTLGEWWSIWQASGKWDLRGRGAGRYCMSRINDAGSYALGNVYIQTAESNSREAARKWRGVKKEFRGVFHLYPGTPRPWQAKFKNRSLGYFATQHEAALHRLSAQMRSEVEQDAA